MGRFGPKKLYHDCTKLYKAVIIYGLIWQLLKYTDASISIELVNANELVGDRDSYP